MTTTLIRDSPAAEPRLSVPLGYRSPTLGGRAGRVESWRHLDRLVADARAGGEWIMLHRLDDPAERFLQLQPLAAERTAIQLGERRAETRRHAVWNVERPAPPAPELHGIVLDWLGGVAPTVEPEGPPEPADDEPF